jgi:hypothetical protein
VVAFEILPIVTICAVDHRFTCSRLVILLKDVFDHADDAMSASTASPAKISNGIVGAGIAGMASALHRVPANGTERGNSVASAHEYWISCVSKVVATGLTSLLVCADMVSWGCGKAET